MAVEIIKTALVIPNKSLKLPLRENRLFIVQKQEDISSKYLCKFFTGGGGCHPCPIASPFNPCFLESDLVGSLAEHESYGQSSLQFARPASSQTKRFVVGIKGSDPSWTNFPSLPIVSRISDIGNRSKGRISNSFDFTSNERHALGAFRASFRFLQAR